MNAENKAILKKINDYADVVLADIDPQKTQVSFQLDKLKPVMEEIAKQENMSLQDVFILYMDLQSEASLEQESKFQKEIEGMGDLGLGDKFHFDVR